MGIAERSWMTHGKTAAARRMLPLSPRVARFWSGAGEKQRCPLKAGYGQLQSQAVHTQPSTLKKQRQRALRLRGVRPFVLYAIRHTFLTRAATLGLSRGLPGTLRSPCPLGMFTQAKMPY